MGVGFGQEMQDTDIVTCQLTYTGTSSTTFDCKDRYANAESKPALDSEQDITTESSSATYDSESTTASFEATFTRPFSISESSVDKALEAGSQELAWAYGLI